MELPFTGQIDRETDRQIKGQLQCVRPHHKCLTLCYPIKTKRQHCDEWPLLFCVVYSVTKRPDDDQVLSVLGEGRRLGVDSESCNDCSQQSLVASSLHCQRQPRSHVSAHRWAAFT